MAEAQRLVSYVAGSAQNIPQAKATAKTTIRGFSAEIGRNVTVRWASEASDRIGAARNHRQGG